MSQPDDIDPRFLNEPAEDPSEDDGPENLDVSDDDIDPGSVDLEGAEDNE